MLRATREHQQDATTIRPRRLQPSSTIGVIAPSSPVAAGLLITTIAYWESHGYRVKVGDHVRDRYVGYLAGTKEDRASDLNTMLRDPAVGLVVAAMGGKGSSQLLPLIDYPAISADPKPIMGLSDPSLLTLAIHARTGVITFHGPTGMCFGRETFPSYSEDAMFSVLTSEEPIGPLPAFGTWEAMRGTTAVTGRLLGGHLGTIRTLLGTPYEPDWTGAILFIEEIDCEYHDIDTALNHFRLAGVFDRIAGLIVGRTVNVSERFFPSDESIPDVVMRACDGYDFPILCNVDIGHSVEKLTLPVGGLAQMDPRAAEITLLEAAVR